MQRARSLLSIALALGLTAALSPTALADEETMAGQESYADASWMFPKAKPGLFTGYMAFVVDQEPSEGPDVLSIAMLMKGPCVQEGDTTSCQGKKGLFLNELKPGQFEVASDWSSAHVAVGKKDERVDLNWTAVGLPLPGGTGAGGGSEGDPEGDYEFETRSIGISRDASVAGTMFGRPLDSEGLEYASFYRGEYRGTYTTGDRSVRIGSVTWLLPPA